MKSAKQAIGVKNPPSTFLKEETCECGELVHIYRMTHVFGPRKGETFIARVGCKCEDKRLARKAVQAYERAKRDKLRETFDRYSMIPPELLTKTILTYQPKTQSQKKAKQIAYRFIEEFDIDKPRNLVFSGSFGIGKSHLAKAITDGIIEKGYEAIFITVPKLLRKFKSTYHKNSAYSEDDLATVLEKVDLLVLDDLGVEKDTDWTDEKLFELIYSRQGKHTIYTTNYNPDHLLELLGERNFSRIFNRDTHLIEIDGDNYRLSDVLGGGRNV